MPPRRAAFLRGESHGDAARAVPPEVRARIGALLKAVASPQGDARLTYFASLRRRRVPGSAAARRRPRGRIPARDALPVSEGVRRTAGSAARRGRRRAVPARGLSTDTAVEAGYVVHLGLGVLKALDPAAARPPRPDRRARARSRAAHGAASKPAPPESYQPWAVIDALLALGLGRLTTWTWSAADINPRVVAHLRDAGRTRRRCTSRPASAKARGLTLSRDYRRLRRSLRVDAGRRRGRHRS